MKSPIKIEINCEIMSKCNIKRNTIILMWNPSISSYTMERFNEDLRSMADGWTFDDFNWSVWQHEGAKDGDKFFMVKVGPGTNGIVMAGTFTSDPYQDEDWSGKGRTTYYMDMEITEMIHPDRCPLLKSEELAREIPDFKWDGGHSGQILTDEQAEKLELLWHAYLDEHEEIFEPRAARQ